MRMVWRAVLVAVVFVGVGLLADRAILRRAADGGMYQPQVRMGAAMGGLFAGGLAATVVLLAVAFGGKKAGGQG